MSNPYDDYVKAFPRPHSDCDGAGGCVDDQDGMLLRDYFAAKALQSLIALGSTEEFAQAVLAHGAKNGHRTMAATAYTFADAMLEARKR